MTLQERRQHETAKYEALTDPKENYGNGMFGLGALQYVLNAQPKTLLDLGCGQNLFVQEIRRLIPGIDAKGLDHAFPQADIRAGMYDIPIEDDTIDMITAFDSLEHLLPEDVPTTFQEMQRVSRPKGRFIVSISHVASRARPGVELHPTVRPRKWWVEHLEQVADMMFLADGYILGSFKKETF